MSDTRTRDRTLIGLSAAVGAGCLPCSGHYLEQARQAGIRSADTEEAVALAVAIRRRAAEEMAWRVLRKLNEGAPPPADLSERVTRGLATLAGLAAAYAANSPPLVRRSIETLRRLGISDREMARAIDGARKPKSMAAKISDREIDGSLAASGNAPDERADCCAEPCTAGSKHGARR